jgi:hypothetical protein
MNGYSTNDKSSRRLGVCGARKTIGQFLVDFGPENRHVSGSFEAELDPISLNLEHHDLDIFPHQHSLARLSA